MIRIRELAVVFVVLAGLLAGVVLASGASSLLTTTPWLDECLTLLVVNDPSFLHGLGAIRGGVENTPPGFFAAIWPVTRAAGGLPPAALRLVNSVFVMLACVGVYATCRLVLDRQRAAIGALVLAIHPAVVVQTFQVRFYAFWLCSVAWLLFLTVLDRERPRRRWLDVARCVLAAAVVSVHWFGIIALGLVIVGDVVTRPANARVRAAVPMVAGVMTLLACLPFLAAQRSGLTVATWIDPLSMGGLVRQAMVILGPAPMMLIIGFVLARVVMRTPVEGNPWRAVAPSLALLAFPVALALLSIVLQPALRSRYMLPAAIPVAIVAATVAVPLTERAGRAFAAIAVVGLMAAGIAEYRHLQRVTADDLAGIDRVAHVVDSVSATPTAAPLLFLTRFEQHPVVQRNPRLLSRTALIDFDRAPDSTRMRLFERDMGRRVSRAYPQFRLAAAADLDTSGDFFVVAGPADEAVLRRLFPHHEIRSHTQSLYAALRR